MRNMGVIRKITDLPNSIRKIETNMIDDIGDDVIIYQENNKFTDDGYFDFQLQCANIESATQRKEILKKAASYFACQVENNEITCTAPSNDDAMSRLLQACTAVIVFINQQFQAENDKKKN